VPKRISAKVEARELAAEIIRRTRATAGGSDDGDSLPYVVRLSHPPTPHERLQLAACRILRHPIAIMPLTCVTVQEWSQRYGKPARR
jgi:hypothetical protein